MSAAKRAILTEHAEKYGCKTFIETGTYMGDTIGAMLNHPFEKLYSIEQSDKYYHDAVKRFSTVSKVTILLGDGELVLPRVLRRAVNGPVLFWLDSHGDEWIGPIVEEITTIFKSGLYGVILVDDMEHIPEILPDHPAWKKDMLTESWIARYIHVE